MYTETRLQKVNKQNVTLPSCPGSTPAENQSTLCSAKAPLASVVTIKARHCAYKIENNNKHPLKTYYGLFILDVYFAPKHSVKLIWPSICEIIVFHGFGHMTVKWL